MFVYVPLLYADCVRRPPRWGRRAFGDYLLIYWVSGSAGCGSCFSESTFLLRAFPFVGRLELFYLSFERCLEVRDRARDERVKGVAAVWRHVYE